jgi:hypothetical protein
MRTCPKPVSTNTTKAAFQQQGPGLRAPLGDALEPSGPHLYDLECAADATAGGPRPVTAAGPAGRAACARRHDRCAGVGAQRADFLAGNQLECALHAPIFIYRGGHAEERRVEAVNPHACSADF